MNENHASGEGTCEQPASPARCSLAAGSPPLPCPWCGAKTEVLPSGMMGKRGEWHVVCTRPRCVIGPEGLSESKAVEYWNIGVERQISPMKSENLGRSPTANAPQGVPLTRAGAAARSDTASESDFMGVLFQANVKDQPRPENDKTK